MQLKIRVGQYSSKGRKDANQDFHGACIPAEPQLTAKGVAIAIADGISSSAVSHIASETAVKSFLEDYYCTSDAWSVKTSAERVLVAANSWLHSQTRQGQGRYDKDRGYVCTLSAMVIKSTTAHLFHVGDTRIYRLHGNDFEQLTTDHRIRVSRDQSYLGRALGVDRHLEIDYRKLQLDEGDLFLMTTDGVYEHVDDHFMISAIRSATDLDTAARIIAEEACRRGSADNLTVQVIRIEKLPLPAADEAISRGTLLPFPPILEARMAFDGYRIVREVHGSHRSHIYLAVELGSECPVIIKTPSIDMRDDPAYLERFLMEEWIARRIDSAHVLKPFAPTRKRQYVYLTTEYIEGTTLSQWMRDHPKPDLETMRGVVDQIARGLRAFHRLEMLHQDLRPENIMIDRTGTVKIIDFGSTRVAGVVEAAVVAPQDNLLGAALYAAPEYFLGDAGSIRSDMYSLGVIAYQMLTERLPYEAEVPKSTTRAAQRKLSYTSARYYNRQVPVWVDEAIRKAVNPDPHKRYDDVSEFAYSLRYPDKEFADSRRTPLIERDPVVFWKSVSVFLMALVVLLVLRSGFG